MSNDEIERRRRKVELIRGSREIRTFDGDVELRETPTGQLALRGYASRFNNWYDVGAFRERVAPGAFTRTLNESPDVSLMLGHGQAGSGLPIARTTAGNLALTQDALGLAVDASPLDPGDPDVQLMNAKMRNGLVSGMSFMFLVTDDAWNSDMTERTLKSVSLHRGDVSLVVHGANELASAELVARSAAASGASPPVPDYGPRAHERLAALGMSVPSQPAREAIVASLDHRHRARLEEKYRRGS